MFTVDGTVGCTGTSTDGVTEPCDLDTSTGTAAVSQTSDGQALCPAGCTGEGNTLCAAGYEPTVANTAGAVTCDTDAGDFSFSGCTDIDECATNNGDCGDDATCTNTPGGKICRCREMGTSGYTGDVEGTTGYSGNCVIGVAYCQASTEYCRSIGDPLVADGTRITTGGPEASENACESVAGQANQWTDNLYSTDAPGDVGTACSGSGLSGVWADCASHSECYVNMPRDCQGSFTAFGSCTDSTGVEVPCECSEMDRSTDKNLGCTHTKTYTITTAPLAGANRDRTGADGAAAAECPQLEPTCTGTPDTTTAGETCEKEFAYASGTTRFNSDGTVVPSTLPGAEDCPAGCAYTAAAVDGVTTSYTVTTSCAQYTNEVTTGYTFTAAYCEIPATDQAVCEAGTHTAWRSADSKCERTIATSKATCEVYEYPQVTECAAVTMVANSATNVAACEAIAGCVHTAGATGAEDTCLPSGTWNENSCVDSNNAEMCPLASTLTGTDVEDLAACEDTAAGFATCTYTPDDAGTAADEESCLAVNRDACEHRLLTIQNGLDTVTGDSLFGTGKIDVGDT